MSPVGRNNDLAITMTNNESDCPILVGAENYQIWKLRISAKLRREKVYGVALGTETQPPTTTPTPLKSASTTGRGATSTISSVTATQDSREIRDGKAHGILIEYISDRILLQVSHHATSQQLWNAIIEMHEKTNTGIAAFYTFIDVISLKWDGTSAVEDHIAKIRSANQKLTQMGKAIDNKFTAFILL